MKKQIGVIAGSSIDTGMGCDMLVRNDISASAYPVSKNAKDQTLFQVQPQKEKEEKILSLMDAAYKNGADTILIYCNSLSASMDMHRLGSELGISVITPLDAYSKIASTGKRFGVLAGNCQGLSGIEKTILSSNPSAIVYGISLFPMVEKIEARAEPARILEEIGMEFLLQYFSKNKVDAIILGCTHFPYVKEALAAMTKISILNPDDTIIRLLNGGDMA